MCHERKILDEDIVTNNDYPFYKEDQLTLHLGNCLNVMGNMKDNNVDSIVTDPPYGLNFMGKDWDHGVPAVRFWEEALRVAKPGAHLLAFGGCYDGKTEVLTKRGWIKFIDATKEDRFASLDLSDQKVEWLLPKEIVKIKHDGEMHKYKTNKIDLLVTPNHKMLIETLGSKKENWRLIPSEKIKKSIKMKKTSNGLKYTKDSPIFLDGAIRQKNSRGGGRKDLPQICIPQEIWAAFLGIWMAEGHATKSKSTHVAITHFDNSNMDEIEKMLSPYFKVKRYRDSGKLRINDPRLYNNLKVFGQAGDKYLPEYVKNWSSKFLKIFLDWYARGDGDDSGRIYTASKRLSDDIQEISMYAGWAADISIRPPKNGKIKDRIIYGRYPQHIIRLLKTQINPEVYARKRAIMPKTIIKKEEWNGGNVYCVELPRNNTLYVRRNGKSVWCGNTRTFHRLACNIEDAGWEIRDCIMWVYASGMPKSLNVSKAIDSFEGQEREVIGYDETRVRPNRVGKVMGEKEYDRSDNGATITAPKSENAKKRDGWGTTLKPAWEPIIIARKPFDKTVAENVIEFGTGGLNIDACRVGTYGARNNGNSKGTVGSNSVGVFGKAIKKDYNMGRFPSNIIHDGSEEVTALLPHLKATKMEPEGSAARFFYCAKASLSDKGEKNNHPTVKPTELMRYLCRLVTPLGGIVLDPFMGSGSTGKGAMLEGFNFIGIDTEEEYLKIAKERILAALNLKKNDGLNAFMKSFGIK